MEHRVPVCFLILHYMDQRLTEQTVTSILGLDGLEDSRIIIVDNGSPNQSGRRLREIYAGEHRIHFVDAGQNLGFSGGNNLGFSYIKKRFDPEFLIMINNDIEFPQKDFLTLLKKLYKEQPFHAAGPDIYVPHKRFHSSPMHDQVRTKDNLEEASRVLDRMQASYKRRLSLLAAKMYCAEKLRGSALGGWLFQWKRRRNRHTKCMERKCAVVLQGSCIIFDRRFCQDNQELLQPLTFLYGEEDLLSWRCQTQGWDVWYFPELQVWHHCQGSAQLGKVSYGKFCDRMRTSLERRRNAVEVLKAYYEEHVVSCISRQEDKGEI